MKVILTPIGSAGDNLPLIGIGSELVRRGHEAVLVGNAHFEKWARAAGVGFIEQGTEQEYREGIENPELWHPTRGFKTVMAMVEVQWRRIKELMLREKWDVAVAPTLDFVSPAVGEKLGRPVVRVHLQPAIMRSQYAVPTMTGTGNMSWMPRWTKRVAWWVVDKLLIDPVARGPVNAIRAELGLAPIHRPFHDGVHSRDLTVGLWPEWFGPVQPDWPGNLKLAGFPLFDAPGGGGVSAEVGTFLAERPLVFTAGSAMLHGAEFFRAAVGAAGKLGVAAMLLTGHREQLPSDLPANVKWFAWAPLSAILPRCSALVHHGGIGTTAAALSAGIPQVIMPMSHDQPDNAERIVRLGAGDRLMPKKFKADRLAAVLGRVLEGEMGRKCAELKAKVESGIGRVAGWVEECGRRA